jgi:hypothetical protein
VRDNGDVSLTEAGRIWKTMPTRYPVSRLLATVLTPDQLQQMKSHHHSHGTPAQAQPQTNPQSAL